MATCLPHYLASDCRGTLLYHSWQHLSWRSYLYAYQYHALGRHRCWYYLHSYGIRTERAPHIIGKIVTWLVVLIALALFVFEHYLLSSYKALYTDSIAVNILATNPSEATEFMSVIPPSYLLQPLGVGLILLYLCGFLLRRSMERSKRPKRRTALLCYIIPLILAIPAQLYFTLKAGSYNFMSPIERIYHGTMDSKRNGEEVAQMLAKLRTADVGEVHASNLGKINVVLIMGESLRRDYMQCYGYPVRNTPHIDSMVRDGSIVLFSNVTAPAPSTVDAVKGNISLHSLECQGDWAEYPTLMSLLSKAGYYTYWVSNQEKQGGFVMPVAAIAETADSTKYIKLRTSSDWAAAYDEEVIPHLLHLQEVNQPLMQVVHLMGSHTAFPQRYPKAYDHFTSKDLPDQTPDGTPRRKGQTEDLNLAQYLNTIIYNDKVVADIMTSFRGEPALVIYTADHGLEIHDDPTSPEHCGHTDQPIGLRIPLMVYATPELRTMHPELWERVVSAKDRRIMTDIMATSICDLLGVRSRYVTDSLSFFSPSYNEQRRHAVSFYERVVEL
ncbi:MAG: sulfatase-like hydrolase/transferase [Porphyromonadaceae bacterium]|nr:sulfatase-like hydrolase/transferase [Porphyromonadaceae bacterium]